MRKPADKNIIRYFASLGIGVSRRVDPEDERIHYTFDPSSPFGNRTFRTRTELWRNWLAFAAGRLQEEDKLRAFIKVWRPASEPQRRHLQSALADYWWTGHSPLLAELFRDLHTPSYENMPRGWRKRIKSILAMGDLESFPTAAMEAIKDEIRPHQALGDSHRQEV